MKTLFTTDYDEQLMQQLDHFRRYPQMLPFVGEKWKQIEDRVIAWRESLHSAKRINRRVRLKNTPFGLVQQHFGMFLQGFHKVV